MHKARLLAPGPVEIPPQVREVLARPALHHRTEGFRALVLRVRTLLAELACVPGEDVLLVTGSGTAAFEAGLLAAVPAGGTVLALHAGKFGERWAALARRYGFDVRTVEAPWGRALDPREVRRALRDAPDVAAVTTTHSETSTGVLHDVQGLAGAVREEAPEALVLVDAVTSLAAAELRPRAWGLDGVFAGSQKGLMLPPGLGFAWLSERAWHRAPRRAPSFYLDLHAERGKQRRGETAFTPATALVAALEVALELVLEDGVEALWARRARLNEAVLAAGEAIGLERFAERPSPAVAALRTPQGVAAPALVRHMAAEGVRIAGGQEALEPRLLRPSVLGWADAYDAVTLAAAMERALRAAGRSVPFGAGVAAALEVLER